MKTTALDMRDTEPTEPTPEAQPMRLHPLCAAAIAMGEALERELHHRGPIADLEELD